jgi:catechol 2,3-dioxygenase-like lactoylglutathione lyase family enzyme
MAILDHIGISVSDIARSRAFYEKALAPLGITVVMEYGPFCGLGRDKKPDFWIGQGKTSYQNDEQLDAITPVHVSFVARSRAEVDAFYKAAMAAGGRDHGAPGPRPEYHPNYYGAFVLDPDGHNVEAVIHTP